jgi:hypothetical protein
MRTLTLTVAQLREIYEAGADSARDAFPYEGLALILQERLNEGVSVFSQAYKHMSDVIDIMEI